MNKKMKAPARKYLLALIDFSILFLIYLMAFGLECILSSNIKGNLTLYLYNFLISAIIIMAVRFISRVYSNVWRYANSLSYLHIVIADIASGILIIALTNFIPDANVGLWKTLALIASFNIATLCSRFIYQLKYMNSHQNPASNKIGIAIVGAGPIGCLLADELKLNPNSHYKPICFIDTDKDKIGNLVRGIKVYDEKDNIIEKLSTLPVQEILIALPKIDGEKTKELYKFYSQSGCKVKLYDFPIKDAFEKNQTNSRVIREIKIEDLLFREPLNINDDKTLGFYAGKTVLITGGGGSIGSELCRQIAKRSPKRLIVFDIYENNAYDIEQELKRKYKEKLDICVEIGSVRDRDRLESVFKNYLPEIVFHAAAHKHVPLMEHSNCEAIKNNVLGTYNTADMSEKYNVKKFVLISTDKAVNPTNVMGASKRLCEMVIQCRTNSNTSFAAVRFGNVLGSNGSVIPLFKKQIENGGPITITDKRIIRYFMTIPEATQLVMQAGAMANNGELFVLDMGKPVRILDLAENMIKLSGLKPYKDIDIVEVGLRPGEKLYEELLMKSETLEKTENDMIFIEKDSPLSREEIDEKLDILKKAIEENKNEIASKNITQAMRKTVPTFHSPSELNKNANNSEEFKLVESAVI